MSLKSERTRVRRRATRGQYDPATVYSILDAVPYCHIGFVAGGQPYVIPTAFGREADRLYIHGSAESRMLRHLSNSVPMCCTVTLFDGLVLARSLFNHSMNYRSAVILGQARLLEGEEKLHGLEVISDHLVPGRWADARAQNRKEMKATSVLCLPITEASAKIRSGPPHDDDADLALPCWAGVVPLARRYGKPIGDPTLAPGIAVPPYVKRLRAK